MMQVRFVAAALALLFLFAINVPGKAGPVLQRHDDQTRAAAPLQTQHHAGLQGVPDAGLEATQELISSNHSKPGLRYGYVPQVADVIGRAKFTLSYP